jgi:hypothetical protein
MSDIGKIKLPIQTIPIRAVNKNPAKKEQGKKKKGKGLPKQEKESSEVHVSEYI